jgi:hypothetical protein
MRPIILCTPLQHPTPISPFIFINVVFCSSPSANHVLFSNREYSELSCMCAEYPRKIVLLIIRILICYVAVCRIIFINIEAAAEERHNGKVRNARGTQQRSMGRRDLR